MSRASEILKRFEGSTSNQEDSALVKRAETPQLWPRFTKVFDAISHSFEEQPPPKGITREFNTIDWKGEDEGIHDHYGLISGQINGIELDIKLKGGTSDQWIPVTKLDGRTKFEHLKVRNLNFQGTFISQDRKKGAVEMLQENYTWRYKAFWLETRNGVLQLEQVVGPNGEIYDANKLEPNKHEIPIPGTRTAVQKVKKLF